SSTRSSAKVSRSLSGGLGAAWSARAFGSGDGPPVCLASASCLPGGAVSSPFGFLRAEFPQVHEGAVKAAEAALQDPRTACFHARWTVEQAIGWAYDHDSALPEPWDKSVSARLNEPAFKELIGEKVYRFAKEVIRLGNHAAHKPQPLTQHDSVAAVSHLFQFCFWFARTYSRGQGPPADLTFDPRSLPQPAPPQMTTPEQVQELQQELDEVLLARK